MTVKKKEEHEVLPKKEEAHKEAKEHKEPKEPVKAYFSKERVLTESSDNGRELYNQSRYGELLDDGRVQLSLIEALYLIEKKKLIAYDLKDKIIDFDSFLKKAQKAEPNFWV
jgi:tRNA splicing endonuclease